MKINENGITRDMAPEEEELYQYYQTFAKSELTPSVLREQAYNTDLVIQWCGAMLTVTEAAQKWQYYAAEGNAAKMDALTALIAAAKAEIRAKYPDNAGGT